VNIQVWVRDQLYSEVTIYLLRDFVREVLQERNCPVLIEINIYFIVFRGRAEVAVLRSETSRCYSHLNYVN